MEVGTKSKKITTRKTQVYMNKILATMALVAALTACTTTQDNQQIISKSNRVVENRKMTPELLWSFGQLSDAQVSPDGTKVCYGVRYNDIPQNKGNREIFVCNIDGTQNTQITHSAESEYGAKWVRNGEKIAYMSAKSGEMQVWEMNPDGTQPQQITQHPGGIADFKYSPDENYILVVANVKYGMTTQDRHPDLDKTTGIVVDDLMYKHWDEWVTSVPHPFLYKLENTAVGTAIDILQDEPYEAPMKPFGGVEQIAFSPDSKKIAYTSRKKTGLQYSISTDSDIYLYDIETKETVNLCKDFDVDDLNKGYDINPAFSPDGSKIAWLSMKNDGYESDKNRLYIMDLETKMKTDYTAEFDQSISSFVWAKDAQSIYFISCWHATTQIYNMNVMCKQITKITEGQHDYESVAQTANGLLGVRHSMSMPNEIYAINEQTGEQTQITFENKHLLDQVDMGKVEPRWLTATDGKPLHTWVIFPPDFDPNKKYPALLYCQGGPQSPVSQFWSTRWNMQIMAAAGYIVVAPNRRGLDGFGEEWNAAISGDYGGQCMRDLRTAIDELAKEPYVDEQRLGCVGASFGGYSVYWMAGHHEKRFKAFIAHDGIFNMEQQYLETEEMWFVNWDMGGAYWDKDNAIAQNTFANSPHKFVDKWDTPILCIHGEKDYRILASQGMSAFNAAKLRGVPAQLLIYPDENHWVIQIQNSILWHRTFINWLDKWLKE